MLWFLFRSELFGGVLAQLCTGRTIEADPSVDCPFSLTNPPAMRAAGWIEFKTRSFVVLVRKAPWSPWYRRVAVSCCWTYEFHWARLKRGDP